MGFDTVSFLQGLFGRAAPATMPNAPAVGPEPAPATDDRAAWLAQVAADAEALVPFLGWVRLPDVTGRLGWEAPDLPEWQRWWAQCAFDDLPEPAQVSEAGNNREPAPEDCAGCVGGGRVDSLDISAARPI